MRRAFLIAAALALLVTVAALVPGGPSTSPSSEIAMTAGERAELADAIRAAGFHCPRAALAVGKGADAYGDVVKVWCGPADRDGVYENAVFRVTFLPDRRLKIAAWRD